MATKSKPETVRLKHSSGVTVSVSADKADRLLAEGAGYSKVTGRAAKSAAAS